MADFQFTIRSQGSARVHPYKGKDGTVFENLLIGGIKSSVVNISGMMIAQAGLEASERVLWLGATYFQRLISRTPRDEDYKYYTRNDSSSRIKDFIVHYHKADDDYMQDYWTARYWNYEGITAKYLRDSCGCNFENFNDPREIEIIYNEFRDRFFGTPGSRGRAEKESGKKTLKEIRFWCDYPADDEHEIRFKLLEDGGYVGDGVIKRGPDRYHGVVNEHSIQAPAGMKAITYAEFMSGQFKAPNKRVHNKNYLKYIGPSVSYSKELEKIIGFGDKYISNSDIAKIMSLYGV